MSNRAERRKPLKSLYRAAHSSSPLQGEVEGVGRVEIPTTPPVTLPAEDSDLVEQKPERHDTGIFLTIVGVLAVPLVFVLQANGVVDIGWSMSLAVYLAVVLGFEWAFWKWQTPANWNKLKRYSVVAVHTVLLLTVSTIGVVKQYRHDQQSVHIAAMKGPAIPSSLTEDQIEAAVKRALPPSVITPPRIREQPADPAAFGEMPSDDLFIVCGGNTMHARSSEIGAARIEPLKIGDDVPFSFYLKDRRLVVNAALFGGVGHSRIEVLANKLKVNDGSWDSNYTEKAMEVVTQDGTPVLQMVRRRANRIDVSAIIPTPNGPD